MNNSMNGTLRDRPAPVVIVGGGPTGLAAALELARQGIDVRVFDKAQSANTESRGTGLQARTLELLELYEATDEILRQANVAKAFITYRNGEQRGHIDFTLAPSRFAGSPALPQAITEGVLRQKLADAGVSVEFGVEVQSVSLENDGCVITAKTAEGEFRCVADWIIAADGARSVVRTLLDLPFDGVSYPEGWGLMDADLDWSFPNDAVRIFRGDGPQQFVAVPLGGRRYRVQLDHRAEALQADPPTLEEMQAALDRYAPVPGKLSNMSWHSAFRVHRRQVVSYRHGRILLAGDAAHIHTPAGAQGLNTGIQDGINLGWKLALVASGKASPALLDTYEAERKPIAAGVLQLAEVLARNPDAMLGDGSTPPEVLAARVGQLLVNYRDGPLGQGGSRRAGELVAGDRLPDLILEQGPLYHQLRGARVTVAVVGSGTDIADLQSVWGEHLRFWRMEEIDPEGRLAAALGMTEGAIVIRPDAYLGLVVESPTPSAVVGAWLADSLMLHPHAQLEAV